MKQFIIKQAGWMEDGFGVSAFRQVGEPINLLQDQEAYLLLSEAIATPPASSPPISAEPAKAPKGDIKNVRD